MDVATTATTLAATAISDSSSTGKRKRSSSFSTAMLPLTAPPAKTSKTASSQLSINYLARQSPEDLPLLNKDDSLPNLVALLSAYSNVLDRHESLASNLGARPLGPILIKRFERCFDAPPQVVASHQRGSTGAHDDAAHQITWLEVIEFARSHSNQFTLGSFSEGRRVCQFYYPQKQLRVQISEEDFLFINSGRCQELIPPLPIWEDEEKEVGACDVLEAKLKDLTNIADMVAARTRQLSHRLKGRRAAILERRAEGGSGTPAKASAPQTTTAPPSGVGTSGLDGANNLNGTVRSNGENEPGSGPFAAVRSELLRHFESLPHNQGQGRLYQRSQSIMGMPESHTMGMYGKHIETIPDTIHTTIPFSTTSSVSPGPPNMLMADSAQFHGMEAGPSSRQSVSGQAGGAVPRPSSSTGQNQGSTPNKHNFSRPLPPGLESSQPYRPACQAHMDGLARGARVLPPCDRCRRLRMDCVKNLTSCQGCTKKHARCHWRDVTREELNSLAQNTDGYDGTPANGYGSEHGLSEGEESEDDDSNPLEDLEALEEKEEKEREHENRENEEGLRNAKELARQAWEDGLHAELPQASSLVESVDMLQGEPPSAEPPSATGPSRPTPNVAVPHAEPGIDQGNPSSQSTAISPLPRNPPVSLDSLTPVDMPVLGRSPESHSVLPATSAGWAALPHPTSHLETAAPTTYSGFRAVNEPMRH
nr:hypothetical protein CFP56_67345 [Quercus suber]